MPLADDVDDQLRAFLAGSPFRVRGGIMTDLDGTAVHEDRGRIIIPAPVELGFKTLHELGRPFMLNTLRFPLSVLRTFGREWYAISNAPIPTVTLNGSLLGYVTQAADGELAFEEISAVPLAAADIDEVLEGVRGLLRGGLTDLLLFYYPRDWRMGELIWTPVAEHVLAVKEKYLSASAVTAVTLDTLRAQLLAEDICMLFLLVDVPEDQRMAYQHTRRSNFVTRAGVDKLAGAEAMAAHLDLELAASIGAGDTELDSFLSGVGVAVHVGSAALPFRGVRHTLRLPDSFAFGALLFRVAELLRTPD